MELASGGATRSQAFSFQDPHGNAGRASYGRCRMTVPR